MYYVCICICIYIYIYIYTYVYTHIGTTTPLGHVEYTSSWVMALAQGGNHLSDTAHGSFQIRRQRGRPGVVLPLVISKKASHYQGM